MRIALYCFAWIPLLLISAPGIEAQPKPRYATAFLEGTVVNSVNGEPLGGARVKLQGADWGNDDAVYTKTDAQGRFQFANTRGLFILVVEKPGFMHLGSSSTTSARPVGLHGMQRPGVYSGAGWRLETKVDEAGELHAMVTIQLTPFAVITGRVTDPEGYPMPNTNVTVWMRAPVENGPHPRPGTQVLPGGKEQLVPVAGGNVQTNDRGEYRVARLSEGTYHAAVQGFPWGWERTYRATYAPNTTDLSAAKLFQLAAGEEVRADIRIVQRSGVRLSGRAVSPPGESPQGSFRQTMLYVQADAMSTGTTFNRVDRDQFEIPDLLPGRYTLTAVTRQTNSMNDSQGTLIYGASRSVDVGTQDITGLDLELKPLEEIQGTVAFGAGCTPTDLTIQLSGTMIFAPDVQLKGSEGRFALPRLAPGHVTLNIQPRSGGPRWFQPVSIRLGDRDVRQSGFDVPLAAGETLNITMGCSRMGGAR